jgi:Sigma-70, region 4
MTSDPGAGKEAGLPFGDLFAAACSDALPERERLIVGRYYGLDGGGCQTLAAVGKSLDRPIGRERVRQIIDRALSRLKGQGTRQRNSGQSDWPCAALRSHAERIVGPQASNWERDAWERLDADPSMIPPQEAMVLLAYFAWPHRTRRQAETAVAPFFQQLREQARREQREASDQAGRIRVATRVQGLLTGTRCGEALRGPLRQRRSVVFAAGGTCVTTGGDWPCRWTA